MAGRRNQVVIFGASAGAEGEPDFDSAEALGRAIAEAGWTVVNGGYGGTMLASARGAARAGGRVIGVGCSAFRGECNEFISDLRTTRDLFERVAMLIELGDAYIVLPGSTGTLVELALVWELVNKGLIGPKPILCWGDYWKPVVTALDQPTWPDARMENTPAARRVAEFITFVSSVDEAIAALRRE